jgi:Ni/Co efflux regulator RcnB
MCKKISAILLSVLLLVSAPGIVVGDVVKDIAKKAAEAAFSEAERQAIEKYYEVTAPIRGKEYEMDHDDEDDADGNKRSGGKKKDKGKGKGKNKRKELPKGIAKKLERGGTLPPGMAKRGLPDNLEKQLPSAPKGYERIVSDGQVVLADIATGVISDIINIGGKSDAVRSREQQAAKSSIPKEEKAPEKSQTPEKPEKKWWQIWKD